jgi:putative ABC transport system substrate-binding protein
MIFKYRMKYTFIAILFVALFLSGCSNAEENKVYRVGVANLAPPLEPILEGFKAGMEEKGYVEGQDIVYIYDGPAPSPEALDEVLENLKNEEVDLVLSFGTLATLKAKEILAGTDIPIVFGPVTDPVASWIVTSVLNPGGNITGIQTGNPTPKRLEWLLKIDPEIKRLYTFNQPDDNSAVQALAALKEIAPTFNVELVIRDTSTTEEITTALNEMPADIDAIFLPASAFFEKIMVSS